MSAVVSSSLTTLHSGWRSCALPCWIVRGAFRYGLKILQVSRALKITGRLGLAFFLDPRSQYPAPNQGKQPSEFGMIAGGGRGGQGKQRGLDDFYLLKNSTVTLPLLL